jgi:adenosylcobinamide-GDP ribazoletransferase
MLAVACVRGVPAARPEGLGATVAGAVGRVPAAVALVLVSVVFTGALILAGVLDLRAAGGPIELSDHLVPWWAAPLAVGVTCVVVIVLLRRCASRFGGVTGDVLGAVVEISLAASLVILVAAAAAMSP